MQRIHRKLSALLSTAACMSLALLPVAAMADTAVSLEGVIDLYAGSMQSSGDSVHLQQVSSGGLGTSWAGIKVSEDLGGGLRATANLASWFRPDTGEAGRFPGDPVFSRAANVGLSGHFGAISLGRGTAPNTLPVQRFNPFGNSPVFSPLSIHMTVPLRNASEWVNSLAGDTGWSNQIKYSTPTINGTTVNLHYQIGEGASDNKSNVGADLLYTKNRLSLTAFFHRVEINNPTDMPVGIVKSMGDLKAARQVAWFIGGSYDLKYVKLFATYDRTSHDVELHDRTHSTGLTVPIGKDELMAAWAHTRRYGAGVSDRSRDTASVGYTHKPSRSTSLYLVAMYDKISTFEHGTSFGAGIRHRF